MKITITIEGDDITIEQDKDFKLKTPKALQMPPAGGFNSLSDHRDTEKDCQVCKKPFQGHRLAKFCSPECRKKRQLEYKQNYDAKRHAVPVIPLSTAFDNPWDCDMCLNAQSLCVLHEKMENEGKQPPRYRINNGRV